jgi:hypothetical protein
VLPAASVLAASAAIVLVGLTAREPSTCLYAAGNPVWDRRAIAIGVAGLAILALHLVDVTRRGASART